jgi:hypothetical protein
MIALGCIIVTQGAKITLYFAGQFRNEKPLAEQGAGDFA